MFEGITDPLRPRDLEESKLRKEQKLKKVILTSVATFPFADLNAEADRLRSWAEVLAVSQKWTHRNELRVQQGWKGALVNILGFHLWPPKGKVRVVVSQKETSPHKDSICSKPEWIKVICSYKLPEAKVNSLWSKMSSWTYNYSCSMSNCRTFSKIITRHTKNKGLSESQEKKNTDNETDL